MDDLSTIVKLGLVAIGLVSVVGLALIGIVIVLRLTARTPCPPDPQAAALPVENADKVQQADNVIVRQEWRQTG